MRAKTLVKTLSTLRMLPPSDGIAGLNLDDDALPEAVMVKNVAAEMHASLAVLVDLRRIMFKVCMYAILERTSNYPDTGIQTYSRCLDKGSEPQ